MTRATPGSNLWAFAMGLVHSKMAVFSKAGLVRIPKRLLYSLTPTLVRSHVLGEPIQPFQTTSTSWMDGLRGLCALFVIKFHFIWAFSYFAMWGFHTPNKPGTDSLVYLATLPPFNFTFDGPSAVIVFFAISGYVCSLRSLGQMHPDQHDTLLRTLSSSIFRRGFRLYLPAAAMMLIAAILAHCYAFSLTEPMFNSKQRANWLGGSTSEMNLPHLATWTEQLDFWRIEVLHLMNIWKENAFSPKHDPHLWTVPYEYRMSLHLYAALLALARCRPYLRLSALLILAALYAYWGRWEGPLFFIGAAGAQWTVIMQGVAKPSVISSPTVKEEVDDSQLEESASTGQTRRGWLHSISGLRPTRTSTLRILGYVLAFYMIGYPADGFHNPSYGYAWLNYFIPACYKNNELKLPKSIGVLLLLFLLLSRPSDLNGRRSGFWHTVLDSSFAQYLGKNMYALYLVHGTILHVVGLAMPWWVWTILGGRDNMWKWALGMVFGWAGSLLLCLWWADVFHREVETRCARLVKWLEDFCCI